MLRYLRDSPSSSCSEKGEITFGQETVVKTSWRSWKLGSNIVSLNLSFFFYKMGVITWTKTAVWNWCDGGQKSETYTRGAEPCSLVPSPPSSSLGAASPGLLPSSCAGPATSVMFWIRSQSTWLRPGVHCTYYSRHPVIYFSSELIAKSIWSGGKTSTQACHAKQEQRKLSILASAACRGRGRKMLPRCLQKAKAAKLNVRHEVFRA